MKKDIENENSIIQGLWIGSTLSLMEQLSIKSYLACGHKFHLYVYQKVKNIPGGTVVKDANTILPEKEIFYQAGSYSGFSNLFRCKLLFENGNWWSDLDSVCLKPFNFCAEYVIAAQYGKQHNILYMPGIIKTPRGCNLMKACFEKANSVDKHNWKFGDFSLRIFIPLVIEYKLESYVCPPDFFCPFNWWEYKQLIDENASLTIPEQSFAIHLWHEMWRRESEDRDLSGIVADKHRLYSERALYGRLQRMYL